MKKGDYNAFPCSAEIYGGLTKREHFAGLAMQGIIASGNIVENDESKIAPGVALAAVLYADALLEALEVVDE